MKAVRVILGLIYDDPWLFGGIVIAVVLMKILSAVGFAGPVAGVVLAVLLFLAILISILQETNKAKRQKV